MADHQIETIERAELRRQIDAVLNKADYETTLAIHGLFVEHQYIKSAQQCGFDMVEYARKLVGF